MSPWKINPLLVKHLITIQDGGIESLIYLAFRSKITPALQAMSASTSFLWWKSDPHQRVWYQIFLFRFTTNMAPWFRNLSYMIWIKSTFVLKSFCYSLIFSICRRLWLMLWRIWTTRGYFTSNSRIFFAQLNSHLPISAHLETKQVMECRYPGPHKQANK